MRGATAAGARRRRRDRRLVRGKWHAVPLGTVVACEGTCADTQLGLACSDAFLFGATTVYKNIFRSNKYVEAYKTDDILTETGMDRCGHPPSGDRGWQALASPSLPFGCCSGTAGKGSSR